MAINKKAIIDAVYLTTGVAAKNPIPPTQWSYNDAIKDDPYDPAAAKKLLADAGYPERLHDRPVGDAGAAAVQPQRQAHRRADAGRSGQGRRHRRDQELRVGRVPQAHAGRRAPDGHARAGPATTATRTTSSPRCSAAMPRRPTAATSPSSATSPSRTWSRRRRRCPARSSAPDALRAGAGDLQGAGAVVHDRARGAAEAGAQGSRSTSSCRRSAATRSTASTSRR